MIKKSEDMLSDEKSKSLDFLVNVNVKQWWDWGYPFKTVMRKLFSISHLNGQ